MRPALVVLHRWVGLSIAGFLVIAGITGAVISWDHELDEWLNPDLYQTPAAAFPGAPLELADRLELEHPELLVTYLPLHTAPARTLLLSVAAHPRSEADLEFNQVALDPETGRIQQRRMWGQPSLSRENLLPFLYKLHYSMHLPEWPGLETGVLFMGVVGILWLVDSFVALIVSFPSRRNWHKSFTFRLREGGFRRTFDLHRSAGVWLWSLVLLLAITSVSMNLSVEVVRPIVNAISPLSASPFDRGMVPETRPPAVSRAQVVELAARAAPALGIADPPGGLFYSPDYGIYGVGFFAPGHDHGDGGLGNPWLYFDAATGESAGADIPGTGSAGDLFMQAQYPLHSGRIAGVPGRIIVSLLGLLVAGLSLTGVIVWSRKRAARSIRRRNRLPSRSIAPESGVTV